MFRKHVAEIMCVILCADSVVQETARQYGIDAVPTFVFFRNGVEDRSMRVTGVDMRLLAFRLSNFY